MLSIALLFFVWGSLALRPFLRPDDRLVELAGDRPVLIEGVVDSRAEASPPDGSRVYLEAERIVAGGLDQRVAGRLLVYVKQGRAPFRTGDRIVFTSRIRKPRNLGLPGERDYARRLAYQGIFATAFVVETDDLVLLRAGTGWRHALDRLAAALGSFIMEVEPGREGAVLKALLLGDRSDVPEQLQESFARSGVNHILSISGFHVGIVFLSLFHALYYLARRSEWLALHLKLKQVLLPAALPVVVFYLFLSGAAPATLRSVLMIGLVVVALRLKREVDPVNTIMLAACAILFIAPQTLFDVSFQLSFLAIWGLALLPPILSAPAGPAGKALRWLLLLMAASAAAILATLVQVAYYFQRVSLVGLVANLLVVPLMGYGAVVTGFLGLAVGSIWKAPGAALLHLATLLVRWSDQVVEYLARAPVLEGYCCDRLDLLLACLVLCALTFCASRAIRYAAVIPLLVALVLRAVPAATAADGALTVYFLSVGQGDGALVHLPDGKWMLVDGGGNATDSQARVGPRLLLPALRALSVRRIDYLVLSHEHPDHLQGVVYLAANYEVGEFLASPLTFASPESSMLKWILASRAVPVRVLSPDHSALAIGGAQLQPLWPLPGAEVPTADANDASLVFRLSSGKSSILFTGDIGGEAEEELVERGVLRPCTLLKVAHHGSRYSSSLPFLQAVRPTVAVISAGYRNNFHLPAVSTLFQLQRLGARVYRTDLEGTVEAVCGTDGTVFISTRWGHFN